MIKGFILFISSVIILQSPHLSTSQPEIEFDSSGRISRVNHFEKNQIVEIEEYHYEEMSVNPVRITHKKRQGFDYIPVKKAEYRYHNEKLAAVEFSRYINGSIRSEGKILFKYEEEQLCLVEYYKRLQPSGRLFMFALKQYLYTENEVTGKRFVQYEINPETLRPMQNSQHVFQLKDKIPQTMRSWKLDHESNTVIENSEKNADTVKKNIEDLEKRCILRSSGNAFTKI